jgi:hypothetical protein
MPVLNGNRDFGTILFVILQNLNVFRIILQTIH